MQTRRLSMPFLGLDNDAAADGQRAVEPGGHDHAAVALDLRPAEPSSSTMSVLMLPSGRVAVAGHAA